AGRVGGRGGGVGGTAGGGLGQRGIAMIATIAASAPPVSQRRGCLTATERSSNRAPRARAIMGAVLPDNLVEQFRAVAVQRLERIGAAWGHVLRDLDETPASAVHRQLHTLNGRAGLRRFADVNLVRHNVHG